MYRVCQKARLFLKVCNSLYDDIKGQYLYTITLSKCHEVGCMLLYLSVLVTSSMSSYMGIAELQKQSVFGLSCRYCVKFYSCIKLVTF